ncbi:MAG: hypothetical protein LBV58_03340 [Acholeplasmatales bacterium]|nr:hypothetical protein [Acholeplasmatales bacterium]
MFLKSEEPAKLRAAISENNIPLMSDVSHAIKGIAGNLSLNLLFEVATKLNTELKTGVLNRDYYEEYEDILNSTIEAVNAVITEISSTL